MNEVKQKETYREEVFKKREVIATEGSKTNEMQTNE